ncbi:hypothetical protein [Paenibacillus agri]|uniref:Uncharacterized protein n=1 Tax=Paenibacillus agri TaxID=2744309 RepID=A0A850EN16_9BACL|nr:hypothetical protein [Paenibacillus agri]NUU62683.1 hypothetical protein [Paenibacillus agri]
MLENLIKAGEELESQAQPGLYGIGKVLSGGDLQKWTARVILYLEKHHQNSSLTKKAIEQTKGNVDYGEYEYLLGLLKAIKENEE